LTTVDSSSASSCSVLSLNLVNSSSSSSKYESSSFVIGITIDCCGLDLVLRDNGVEVDIMIGFLDIGDDDDDVCN
jgi:hypothetical protein